MPDSLGGRDIMGDGHCYEILPIKLFRTPDSFQFNLFYEFKEVSVGTASFFTLAGALWVGKLNVGGQPAYA